MRLMRGGAFFMTRRSIHNHESKLFSSTNSTLKSYHEIPTHHGLLPSSVNLLLNGGPAYLHEHCDKRHRKLGPIYREKLGPNDIVFIANTRMIKTVLANEGPYPHHNVPDAWIFYNKVKHVERGLFFQLGETWSKLRKVMNKVLLADHKNINEFSHDIMHINYDLLRIWRERCEPDNDKQEGAVIDDVKKELCKWSIESTGYMLFGSRMGCIPSQDNPIPDSRANLLVENVAKMFAETSRMQIVPVELAHRLNLGVWKRFEEASSIMIKIANEYVRENMPRDDKPNAQNSIMSRLLKYDTLSEEEVSRSVVDLIIAAADTTSNALQWMLYIIAQRQDIQKEILSEIKPLLDDKIPIENFQERAPYLKAFIREVSRLYPTAPFLARTLDKDIVLAGYEIPAEKPIVFSLYTTSRMPEYFNDPLMLRPERWLRPRHLSMSSNAKEKDDKNSAFASLPFGFGVRSCVGRRAAELQMSLFIAAFVKEFASSSAGNVNVKLSMILGPDKPIKLKLRARTAH